MSLRSTTYDCSRWVHRIAPLTTLTGESIRINYIDCPVPGSSVRGVILLIHGFPQTNYQFRHVITPLSDAGYRVIAPDYRGAGKSSKPRTGYEKMQMAEDLHILVHDHLEITGKVHVVGHDIGGMIAWAYAARYSDDVASLIWGECPLPGTKFYDESKGTPELFHFNFHRVPDLPEALVAGREKIYIQHFYEKLCVNSAAITEEDLEVYTTAFAAPGAMRAGFEVYRAFEKDKEENNAWINNHGRLKVPTLALFAGGFMLAEKAEDMVHEICERGETFTVKDSGHWIAEEKPEVFVEQVLSFVKRM